MAEQASTVSAVDRKGMGEKGDFIHSEHQGFTV